MDWLFLSLVGLLISAYWLYRWTRRPTAQLNAYFYDATLLYVFGSIRPARTAAMAALAVASYSQRQSMLSYLTGLQSGFADNTSDLSDDAREEIQMQLSTLIEDVEKLIASEVDEARQKALLEEENPAMLTALNDSNGKYFRRAYPKFFEK